MNKFGSNNNYIQLLLRSDPFQEAKPCWYRGRDDGSTPSLLRYQPTAGNITLPDGSTALAGYHYVLCPHNVAYILPCKKCGRDKTRAAYYLAKLPVAKPAKLP
jgi:hypothetical protein